jgi:hypothetical protein
MVVIIMILGTGIHTGICPRFILALAGVGAVCIGVIRITPTIILIIAIGMDTMMAIIMVIGMDIMVIPIMIIIRDIIITVTEKTEAAQEIQVLL